MLSKIDLSKVVINHLKTFRTNQGKIDIQAILFFYILPFCLSFPLAFFFHIRINECIITAVISAFSIFGALLFALPMSFITLKQQVKGLSTTTIGERNTKKSFCKLLDITFHNLNYCIAIALFTILITILLYCNSGSSKNSHFDDIFTSPLIFSGKRHECAFRIP